ncbi:Signal peptide region containing protein [Cryptosporidium felis]|nr:Signal peptide region containing protein [Cryptosporidium felis]
MNAFKTFRLILLSLVLSSGAKKGINNIYDLGRLISPCLVGLKASNEVALDQSVFGMDTEDQKGNSSQTGNSSEVVNNQQPQMLINFDYLNITSTIDQSSESFTSFDGCSLFEEGEGVKKGKDEGAAAKTKRKGISIQEQLSSDLLALGTQAILKRKYNSIRFSSKFSFEDMTKCLFEDKTSKSDGINTQVETNYNDTFVECCSSYIINVLGKATSKNKKKADLEKYISEFCTDLKEILEEMGIAFRIPFKWLPSASEKISFLSKLKITGSKNLVNNKKYCHLPRKTLDIVFDVDLTLLTMVPVHEVTPGEKSIMLEMLEIPSELKTEGKELKFATRRASDSTIRYNIPHEVHLNPQTIGLLFSLYYRRFLDPCVGSLSILSAGFNTILKFATSMDIEPIMSPSRFHLSDTLLELFPDDNERLWATERPSLLAFRENRISSVQIPPLHVSRSEKSQDREKPQKLIRSFSEGFPELVYNALPFLVKDMQRYRLHITLQKGSTTYDYMLLSEELNPNFLNTLRYYQTMKRYPILTHPFNSPKLFSNNKPLVILIDDELLHFTYACSMEAWSDNVLIAWTEKLGPRELKTPFSKYYLPIPLQHINPKPIRMGELSRNLNMMMNLDYFEGLTFQISQLRSLNATLKSNLTKEKRSKAFEDLKDMEQFLSSVNENELDWSGNLNTQRDHLFNINITDSSNSITPNKLLQLVYPEEQNSKNMFSCPYDISNIKLFYIVMVVPCEVLFIIFRKIKELEGSEETRKTGTEREQVIRLVKMVDMFVITNEKKDELCDRFISSLSGSIAFKNQNTIFYKKVIYSSIPSLPVLKFVTGLPIYRTITIWLQSFSIFEEFPKLRLEAERQISLIETSLQNTDYEPIITSNHTQSGIIYDRSAYDIENLVILEPIKGKLYKDTTKSNTKDISDAFDIFKLLSTIRGSLELAYRDVKKRMNLENPTSVTSQAVIGILMYSICYGIAVEKFSKLHLNICNLGRPVFSRPLLRRNQMDWMRFSLTNTLTDLNIKLSFPIARSFERRFESSIYVSNPKTPLSNSLFQPYFSGTPYRPVKSKVECNESLQDQSKSSNFCSGFSKNTREVVKKNLVMLHDDILEYLVNSLSSLDYQPYFIRQCVSVTTSFVRFQTSASQKETLEGVSRPSNNELAAKVCQTLQDYLQERVPEFFKI